jgi:hypothetical protein
MIESKTSTKKEDGSASQGFAKEGKDYIGLRDASAVLCVLRQSQSRGMLELACPAV